MKYRENLVGKIINNFLILEQYGSKQCLVECCNCKHRFKRWTSNIKKYNKVCKYCTNKPKCFVGLTKTYKQYIVKAKESSREFSLSLEEFRKITSSNCYYCGCVPHQVFGNSNTNKRKKKSHWGDYNYNGVDRKNNNIGYTLTNCVPCCWPCNHAKGKKSYTEFINWLDEIAKFRQPYNAKKFKIPKVQVLVGMIASAKSTYSTNAAQQGSIIINDDSIIEMVHGANYKLYDKELKPLYKTLENQILSTALALGRSVVIDRGVDVNKKTRQRWITLAHTFDVPCEAIIFPVNNPEIHAKRRFESNNRGHSYEYWLKVAQHHKEIYEEPKLEEGFNKIHYINFEEISSGKVIL